jgi:hypothetical protein
MTWQQWKGWRCGTRTFWSSTELDAMGFAAVERLLRAKGDRTFDNWVIKITFQIREFMNTKVSWTWLIRRSRRWTAAGGAQRFMERLINLCRFLFRSTLCIWVDRLEIFPVLKTSRSFQSFCLFIGSSSLHSFLFTIWQLSTIARGLWFLLGGLRSWERTRFRVTWNHSFKSTRRICRRSLRGRPSRLTWSISAWTRMTLPILLPPVLWVSRTTHISCLDHLVCSFKPKQISRISFVGNDREC